MAISRYTITEKNYFFIFILQNQKSEKLNESNGDIRNVSSSILVLFIILIATCAPTKNYKYRIMIKRVLRTIPWLQYPDERQVWPYQIDLGKKKEILNIVTHSQFTPRYIRKWGNFWMHIIVKYCSAPILIYQILSAANLNRWSFQAHTAQQIGSAEAMLWKEQA